MLCAVGTPGLPEQNATNNKRDEPQEHSDAYHPHRTPHLVIIHADLRLGVDEVGAHGAEQGGVEDEQEEVPCEEHAAVDLGDDEDDACKGGEGADDDGVDVARAVMCGLELAGVQSYNGDAQDELEEADDEAADDMQLCACGEFGEGHFW